MIKLGNPRSKQALVLCTEPSCEINEDATQFSVGIAIGLAEEHNDGRLHQPILVLTDEKHPLSKRVKNNIEALTEVGFCERR